MAMLDLTICFSCFSCKVVLDSMLKPSLIPHEEYVLMIHYRNPSIYDAGSESFINSQIKVLTKRKIDVIVLFPVRKLILKAWGVVSGGKYHGTSILKRIINARCKAGI